METISVEEAEDIVLAQDYIAYQRGDEHRWYTEYLVVFETPRGNMGFYYLDPASELQEDQDRFYDDPVEIFPVSPHEVVTTVYERDR